MSQCTANIIVDSILKSNLPLLMLIISVCKKKKKKKSKPQKHHKYEFRLHVQYYEVSKTLP